MLGSELLLKCLEEKQVKLVFGIPGGVVIPLYDVLKKSNIKHILTRHEQGAAHAADGYARSTGKVGVCFATSGPGATNLLTGLATAYMDSSPVVAITGQVAKAFLGKDSFQEADTVGLSQPVTKHNYLVRDANEIPDIVAEAFYIATHGRPGPVLIDIPKDVFTQEVSEIREPKIRKHIITKLEKPVLNEIQLGKALELLKHSKRPLILAGGGVTQAEGSYEFLRQVAMNNEIPVAVTLMGKGVFPADNPLFLGMVGMHGTTEANWAIQNCDCLLAIGIRFDDRVTGKLEEFASKAKKIHVDIDAAEIGKNCAVDVPICADSYDFLKMLSQKLRGIKINKDWLKQIELNKSIQKVSHSHLDPQEVMATINSLVDEKTIVVTDVGQHQMWAALFVHPHYPRGFITSGGLGTMGFGLPAAIGVQMANPEKKVVLITGDGSLQMNIQELALIKQWNLPIKIFLINNGYLGMVRQWQELFFNENYAETSLEAGPDWEKLAQAYGIKGKTLRTPYECKESLNTAISSREPWLMDIKVDPGANVFPMVPAGCSLDQIWGSWKNEAHVSSLG
ncbi:MAG: acetolactate synthase large subunit [Clostridia bacterium]|nr:acetolactate synthase large subunit [Clostridia bacterium]